MPPLAAQTWHLTLSKTDGRDKLFRLLQYLCKLLRGISTGHTPPTPSTPTATLAALESSLAASRQIWRLFKWASVYANRTHISNTLTLEHITSVTRDFAMFAYYICDNLTFLHKLRLLRGHPKPATRRAARFWLAAVLTAVTAAVHRLHTLHIRQQTLRKVLVARVKAGDDATSQRAEHSAVLRARRAALANLLKNASDCVVAWNLTRVTPLHPAVVGACGVVSSFVGFTQVWPRYLPTE